MVAALVERGALEAAPPARVGRYELFESFASGGMASVHLGRLRGPVGFARVVAVKRLHPHLASRPDVVNMLVDEARLAARIRHLNVVPTLDVISEDNELLVVMEYVHGTSLAALLSAAAERHVRCPPAIALALVRDVLRGLHAAHEARDENGRPLDIVHRDVSPQNVIVGSDGVARVVDFGVAKARNRLQESTRDGDLKGKLSYMAPEQLKGATATRQSDIYGAGVLLWECLTGTRLFSSENEAATWLRVLNEVPSAPSARAPHISRDVDNVVLASLSKDPTKREPTAHAMAERLEACGPLATPGEVAVWVQSIVGADLERRERLLSSIERTPGPIDPPVDEGTQTRAVWSRRNFWLAVVAASVVIGVLVAFATRPTQQLPPASADTPTALKSATVAPPVSASAATLDTPPPLPPASVVMVAPPTLVPTATAPQSGKSGSGSRKPPPIKRDCDPPFVVDRDGVKIYKEHCFK